MRFVRSFSKKFNPEQSAYYYNSTRRREALAFLWAVEWFCHLMVRTTTFWTDHQPLKGYDQCRTDVQDLFLQR
jgi:hypothetical protein